MPGTRAVILPILYVWQTPYASWKYFDLHLMHSLCAPHLLVRCDGLFFVRFSLRKQSKWFCLNFNEARTSSERFLHPSFGSFANVSIRFEFVNAPNGQVKRSCKTSVTSTQTLQAKSAHKNSNASNPRPLPQTGLEEKRGKKNRSSWFFSCAEEPWP